MKVLKDWKRLPMEVVMSLLPEIFKNELGKDLSSLQ